MQKYTQFQNEDNVSDEIEIPGVLEFEHTDIHINPKSSKSNGKMVHLGTSTFVNEPNQPENKDGHVTVSIPDPAGSTPHPNDSLGVIQFRVRRCVEHLAFRIFSVTLIFIDIGILIAGLPEDTPEHAKQAYDLTALCFVCYFLLEVMLRIFSKGPSEFFHTWFNVVDLIVVIVSLIVTIFCTVYDVEARYAKLVVAGRLIRIVIFARLCTERKHLEKGARLMVSQNKRRYQKDGFDLDLTYVTERIIAMSFPSYGKMSLYRNPIKEVGRFLDTKHPDHYKVYNLCSERTYEDTYFHGRVERFIIDDHNVPLLKDMVRFVKNVHAWLNADSSNVIAVHCKGGKGRTGTMICVWLVEAGLFGTAEASLDYFGNRRTDLSVGSKFQGVETPSQSRYVGYFEDVKENYGGEPPAEIPLKLRKIKIYALASVGRGNGMDLSCEIFAARDKVHDCHFGQNKNCQADYRSEADVLDVTVLNCPILSGDIKLKFSCSTKGVPKGYENCPFYFWFHTTFIQDNRLYLNREQLDNPHKPKTWKTFREKFGVEVIFTSPDGKGDIELK